MARWAARARASPWRTIASRRVRREATSANSAATKQAFATTRNATAARRRPSETPTGPGIRGAKATRRGLDFKRRPGAELPARGAILYVTGRRRPCRLHDRTLRPADRRHLRAPPAGPARERP